MHTPTEDGQKHRFTCGHRDDIQIYRVTYEWGLDEEILVDDHFKYVGLRENTQGKPTKTDISTDQYRAVEADYEVKLEDGGDVVVKHRIYRVGYRLYQLIVMTDKEYATEKRAETDRDRFFESFEFDEP